MRRRRHEHHARLLSLQKKIHRMLRSDADRLLGLLPPAIRRYEAEFRGDFRSLPQRLPSIQKGALIRAIRAADVSFIADFHTFPQSSRTALRLLREAYRPGETWMLGLEFLSSQYQPELDAYQAGKLGASEFLKRVNYSTDWGFPWSTYTPLLAWARENGVRAVALNRPKELLHSRKLTGATVRRITDPRELEARDEWAAGLITDFFAEQSDGRNSKRLRMIVLYGELHVASSHLPLHTARISRRHLGKALRTFSVHQNYEELYWKLARTHRELEAQIIPLKTPRNFASHSAVCVLSSTPWTQLQSLVSWAEEASETHDDAGDEFEEDADSRTESATDILSLMRTYGESLTTLLQLPEVSFDALTVLTLEQADALDRYSKKSSRVFSAPELAIVKHHVRNNLRLYLPRVDTAYLSSPSHNIPAEMAAIHLFRSLTRTKSFYSGVPEDFYRAALESAFGFFGSLLLNPRRKCDLPRDHEKRLRELSRGKRPAYELEKESRRLALAFLDRQESGEKLLKRHLSSKRLAPAVYVAARDVGFALGKKLHAGFLSGRIGFEPLHRLLTPRSGEEAQPFQPGFKFLFEEIQNALAGAELAATKTETI